MRRALFVVLAVIPVAWFAHGSDEGKAGGHRAGEPKHGLYTPDKLEWRDGPPSLPAGAKMVLLEGDPSKEGYFAMRVQLPDGYRIPPHSHPTVERLTVISGVFRLGTGERFERDAAKALPAGSYVFMEPGMRHYAWAEGPTVVQITTLGPWAINYVNPADDPRRSKK